MTARVWVRRLLITTAALAVVATGTTAPADAATKTMGCVAHRGAHKSHDEESAQSLTAAWTLGCDAETDVHITKDGIPILQHDPTLQRTLGQPGVVHDYTAAQMVAFTGTHHGEHPITYATAVSMLANFPGRRLYVEVWPGWWSTARYRALQTVAENAGVVDRVILYSGKRSVLDTVHAAAPGAAYGEKDVFGSVNVSQLPSYVRTVFLDIASSTAAKVAELHASGRVVIAGNAVQRTDFDNIAPKGYDTMSTDNPDRWKTWHG